MPVFYKFITPSQHLDRQALIFGAVELANEVSPVLPTPITGFSISPDAGW
jgi:hypothetical protein